MKALIADSHLSKAPRLFDVVHEADEITALHKKLARGKTEDSESDEEEDSSDEESDQESYESLKNGVLATLGKKMAAKEHKKYFKSCRKVVKDGRDHHRSYKSQLVLRKIVKQIKNGCF